jgi:DNA-binding transcriptional LysR family regulator
VLFTEFRLFRDVAETCSLSRAAELNNISQPAATQHVRELEKHLGTALLDRSTRPVRLTDAGRLYAKLCQDVLLRSADFQYALENLRSGGLPAVRVASIYSIGLSEAPRLREKFAALLPGIALHIDFLHPAQVYDKVLSGEADLGFLSYPEPKRGLKIINWRKEQMTVALYPGHRLARRRRVLPADLEGETFVAFDDDIPIRRELDRFFEDANVHVAIAAHFDNIQSIKEAVALGSGISILPARAMEAEVKQGRLVSLPLDAPGLARPTAVIHRSNRELSQSARALLGLIRRGVKEESRASSAGG